MFTLDQVVLWGRSFDEYRRMFAISEADLSRRILGCADGPASFNAELSARGGNRTGNVVSCDPMYRFSKAELRGRIGDSFHIVLEQTRRNAAEFVWNADIPDIDALGRLRMAAMERFLDDYALGREERRYINAELPSLPFGDDAFDLAVCSHFLFLYSAQFSADFHMAAVAELCRVAREVRIFPLLELGSIRSRHVDAVVEGLREGGFRVGIETVDYEFQRGGNQMLRIER